MELTCPKCSKILGEDYGMVTCPNCHSVLFIDMEGEAHISQEAEVQAPAPQAEDASFSEIPANDPTPVEVYPTSENETAEPEASAVEPLDLFALNQVTELGPAEDPLGIQEFANSTESAIDDGLLRYNVSIQGVDTKEIREAIREVLEEPRLFLPADRLMKQIKLGQLTIRDLSPVKAAHIVARLKRLDIRILWEQYAIHAVEPKNSQSSDLEQPE